MNGLWQTIMDNVLFVVEFLGVVGCSFLLAYGIEKYSQSRRNVSEKIFTTRATTMIGMFSAIAFILFLVEFPLPFAPAFYQVDFSELPVLIGTFAFGPVAGVMIEFCKILIKLLIKGTGTAFVGELANFAVGCALLLPASLIQEKCHFRFGGWFRYNDTFCSILQCSLLVAYILRNVWLANGYHHWKGNCNKSCNYRYDRFCFPGSCTT